MSGLIRTHTFNDGAALDRRRIVESLLEAALRYSQVNQWALGDNIFLRSKFDDDAWEEYRFSPSIDGVYRTPAHGHLVSGCYLQVNHSEEYYEGVVSWSISVQPLTSACKRIVAWPVCNGSLLMGGHDAVDCDQMIMYNTQVNTDPAIDPETAEEVAASSIDDASSFTLGGSAAFAGVASASNVGVLVVGIGNFQVTKASIGHRKVLR